MASPPDSSKHLPQKTTSSTLETDMEGLKIAKHQLAKDGEGDVVLVYGKHYPMETTVSAKVLSDASPVFKEMLAAGASDKAPRSVTNPQRLAISEDVPTANMNFLVGLLHGRRPDSEYPGPDERVWLSLIGGMAIVAKQFHAVDALKETIAPILLKPFAKRAPTPASNLREQACNRDANLAMTALLLEQELLFAVFTRRMILDHCIYLSILEPAILEQFPPTAILRLEEQRIAAREVFDTVLEQTTTHTCMVCSETKHDPSVLNAISERLTPKLLVWPPRYVTVHSMRQVITAMYSLGDAFAVKNEPHQICSRHINPNIRIHGSLRQFANVSSRNLLGLCLKCTKAGSPQFGDCEHLKAMADRIVSLDPIG